MATLKSWSGRDDAGRAWRLAFIRDTGGSTGSEYTYWGVEGPGGTYLYFETQDLAAACLEGEATDLAFDAMTEEDPPRELAGAPASDDRWPRN